MKSEETVSALACKTPAVVSPINITRKDLVELKIADFEEQLKKDEQIPIGSYMEKE